MKQIIFRPLRMNKSTGKVVVASYQQWRKVKTADYNKFSLIVDNEYKDMDRSAYVHDHKGELLFFYTYNPSEIPVYQYCPDMGIEGMHLEIPSYGINWGGSISYNGKGIDCDGVPTFSHFSADYLGTHGYTVNEFEPLTVDTVIKWFGWFLLQLDNSYLQIGK